jgi:hypothetical protein
LQFLLDPDWICFSLRYSQYSCSLPLLLWTFPPSPSTAITPV